MRRRLRPVRFQMYFLKSSLKPTWRKKHECRPPLNAAPLLRDHVEVNAAHIQMILEIDAMALSEYVDTVRRFSDQAGDGVPAMLERVRTIIDHDRWRWQVQFLQCLHVLTDDWNEAAGRIEFKKLGSMAAESDIEILQL